MADEPPSQTPAEMQAQYQNLPDSLPEQDQLDLRENRARSPREVRRADYWMLAFYALFAAALIAVIWVLCRGLR